MTSKILYRKELENDQLQTLKKVYNFIKVSSTCYESDIQMLINLTEEITRKTSELGISKFCENYEISDLEYNLNAVLGLLMILIVKIYVVLHRIATYCNYLKNS